MRSALILIPSILLSAITSCKTNSQVEIHLLDTTKKWVYIDNATINPNSKAITFIRFGENNHCENVQFSDHAKYNDGEWEYSPDDSLLIVFDHEFKILKVQSDTISVKYKNEDFKALFVNLPLGRP